MRAPPEAETMISGTLRSIDRSMARVITSPTTVAHAAADEPQLHGANVDPAPVQIAAAGNDGVAKLRGFLRSRQPLLVGFRNRRNSSGSVDTSC